MKLFILICALFSSVCFASKIDLKNPTILLEGDITPESVLPVKTIVNYFNKNPIYKGLTIKINSDGGLVDSGLELLLAIKTSKIPITCVVDNKASSMAFMILQACHVRLMTKQSNLMAHEMSVVLRHNVHFSIKELIDFVEELKIENKMLVEHQVSQMKISANEFLEKTNGKDWNMGWQEALKVGAVDAIVESNEIGTPLLVKVIR